MVKRICLFAIIFLCSICASYAQSTKDSLPLRLSPQAIDTGKRPKAFIMPQPLQAKYYYDHLGIICKKELQLEKAIKVPVKIRLGSYDYTKYLETNRY